MTNKEFTQVLAKAKLLASYDPMADTMSRNPGISPYTVFPIAHVQGLTGSSVVTAYVVEPKDKSAILMRALFYSNKGKPKFSILCGGDEAFEYMPASGVYDGKYLVFSGTYWDTTSPHVQFFVYQRKGRTWIKTGESESKHQREHAPPIRLARDLRSIAPAEYDSYWYPTYIEYPGTGKTIVHRERWVFRNGKMRLVSDIRVDSPLSTLDYLYRAICRNDKVSVRKWSASLRIYRRLLMLRERIASGSPMVAIHEGKRGKVTKEYALRNLGVWFQFVRKGDRWVVGKLTPYREEEE
jgi:hypothetical protein